MLEHISSRTAHEVRSLREKDCHSLASFHISKALLSWTSIVTSEAEESSARAIVTLEAAKAASTITYSVLGRLVDRRLWLSIWVPFAKRITSQAIEIFKSCDDSELPLKQAKGDSALSFGLVFALSALGLQGPQLDLPPADLVKEIEGIIRDYAGLLDPSDPLTVARDQTLAILQIAEELVVVECSEEDLPQKPKSLLPTAKPAPASSKRS
jgi:hypothetical protein